MRKALLRNNPLCWVTCWDCGHRHPIRRAALSRNTRVRCTRCGGPVDPSAQSLSDMSEGIARRKDLAEQHKQNSGDFTT